MPNPYNDVELTEDDKQSIYEPAEAESTTKSSQTHEADTLEGETEVSESDEFNLEDYEVEIDGETFDGADILKWQDDSANKDNWQAKNTQEAQNIAKWSKLSQKLSEDTEFSSYMKDYFYDNEEELNKLGLNNEFKPLDSTESVPEEARPEDGNTDKYTEVSGRLDEMEFERHVDELEDDLEELIENNQSFFEDEGEDIAFLEFAEESGMTDLNQAFKVWAYDTMNDELDHHRKLDGNRERNQGKVVHNSRVGATEEVSPVRRTSVKDINYDDPDIRKYFDN